MTTSFPIAATAHLPIAGVGHSTLPVIFVEDVRTKAVEPLYEGINWASALSVQLKSISVHKHLTTLCNFINFYHLFNDGQSISLEQQTYTLLAYIDFRTTGTNFLDHSHPLRRLNWDGVAKSTASVEFKYLLRFFEFLEHTTEGESTSLEIKRYKISSSKLEKLKSLGDRDFFIHLSQAREQWEDVYPNSDKMSLNLIRSTNRTTGHRQYPSEEEIHALISAEKNPVFKAIWLLQSYGASHRISETLNIWQEDILPPNYTEYFFGIKNQSLPTVLIAHPSESTWLGKPHSKKTTRMQHLLQKYGIKPRPERSSNDPLYAGFKAKMMYGTHLTANTWWLNNRAAELFQECVEEIEFFHRHNRTSRIHPYFFINMHAKDESQGNPVTKNRIEKAWKSACKRVGIPPHHNGRNIHGMRHFQKSLLNSLGIPPDQIQIIRGDTSIKSQEDYGICAKSLKAALLR